MDKNILSPFLRKLVELKGSDIYMTAGLPVCVRTKDSMVKITDYALDADFLVKVKDGVLNEDQIDEFETAFELNLSLKEDDGSRFRVNLFYQQGKIGLVIRLINSVIPSADDLSLPSVYKDLIMRNHGLILLASSTGSGKSSSMAAMIDHRNINGSGHILTIEDPIEYVHKHKNCIITQREVGIDTYSYDMALRNALRQRADVVMIGEIRDKDSIKYAIKFAETGHLCVATMHSSSTYQAIERIANFFSEDARSHVLTELSNSLLGIISQKLVPNRKDSLSLAAEIMLNEGLIKNLISEDRLSQIPDSIVRNYDSGMQTMDQALLKLYEKDEITLEVALKESDNMSSLKLMINQSATLSVKKSVNSY